MSGVGADPAQLDELRRELLAHRRTLDAAVEDVTRALWRLDHRSTAATPDTAVLIGAAATLRSGLLDVAREVGRTADAFRAADRGPVAAGLRGGVALWTGVGDVRTVADGGHDLALVGRSVLRHRAAVRLRDVAGLRTPGPTTAARVAALADDVAVAAGRTAAAGGTAVGAVAGDRGLARVATLLTSGRVGAVVRLGGRAIAVAGVAASTHRAVTGFRDGDEEEGWLGLGGAVAGVALLSGVAPLALAGAVVTAGLLVYEHRATIGAGVRAAGRGVRRARRSLQGLLDGG